MSSLKKVAGFGMFLLFVAGSTLPALEQYPLKEKVVDLGNNVKLELVLIQPGKFILGCNGGEANHTPARKVELTKAYWIGKYEVTNELFNAVNGISGGSRFPKTMNRTGALAFAQALAQKTNLPFRLLTEAEHVHAKMAGSNADAWLPGNWSDYAWFSSNSPGENPHEVGLKLPNPWGLFDISGNAHEYVSDYTSNSGYPSNLTLIDPIGVPYVSGQVQGISCGGGAGDGPSNGGRCWNFTFEGQNARTGTRVCLPAPELTADILNDYPDSTTYPKRTTSTINRGFSVSAPQLLSVSVKGGSVVINAGKPGVVSVYTVSGKLIRNITIDSHGGGTLDLNGYRVVKGCYIFKFVSGSAEVQTKVSLMQ